MFFKIFLCISFYLLSFWIPRNGLTRAQEFEIKFDSLNAFGWFGGDDNPTQHRNVAAAQSVTIDQPVNLESFAFYFSAPFDSNLSNPGVGWEVNLILHVRDSTGEVLTEDEVIVPDTFSGGWVTWLDIDYNLVQPGKYIFSCFLNGGSDSLKVSSSQACDLNGGYEDGELFIKELASDSEAVIWGDWSQHIWDAAFWLKGTVITTDVVSNTPIVDKYLLEQNYPNPFNPSTKIKFTIPAVKSGHVPSLQQVTLKVYDILGNEVAELVNELKHAGTYEVEFSASDGDEGEMSSGIYLYQLKTGFYSETKKLILMK